MADIGSLVIHIGVDTKGVLTAETAIRQLGGVANKVATQATESWTLFSKATTNSLNIAAQRIRTFGYLSSAVLTFPMVAFGKSAINAASEFEFAMSKIEGLAGIPNDLVRQWTENLKSMSVETGQAPQALADSLYYVASAGFKTNEALDIVRNSALAASAGMGDAAIISDVLVSALNAYKTSGLDASRAMDIFVAAVREGKVEPAQFASSIGSVLPVASELGVSFDQVTAAMAAMSLSGATAANSATYLRNVLQKLADPSAEVQDALVGMGITAESLRQSLAQEGLLPTLLKLRDLTEQYGSTMFDIFPNIRALIGALNLTGQNLEYNERIFKVVLESTGDFNKAIEVASKTIRMQLNQALASAKVSIIELGNSLAEVILPFLQKLVKTLENLTKWFGSLDQSQKRLIITIAGIVAALGPLSLLSAAMIYTFTGLSTVIGGLISGFKKLGETLKWVGFVMQYYSFVGYTEAMKKIPNMTSLTSSAMLGLGKVVGGLSEAVSVLGGAFLALPLLPIAAGFALFISEHIKATKAAKEMKNVLDRVNSSISDEEVKLGLAFNQLRNTTQGTNDRAEAIDLINNRYGEYLNNMLTEKSSLEDIADAQNQVTLAMTKRIATESLQAEKAGQMSKIAAAQHKYLGDYIVKYQKSLEVMGKMPMKSAELTSSFMNDLNETIDFMVRQMPRDIAVSEAVRVKVNINPLASFDKKDIDVTNAALQDYLDASLKDFMKLKDGAFDLEEAISIVNSSVQEAGLAWKVFDGFYEKYLKPLNISMEEARNAFADFIEVRKQADPIIKALDLEIQGYSGVALKAAEAAEAVRNLAEEQSNPVLKKILEDMQRQESSLIKMKNAFKNAGISTEEVNSKLINLYKTAQEDLGATGLKEAVPVIKTLDELINALTLNLQKSGISLDDYTKIVQDFTAESEYLKYMAVRAHKLGIEFDYIGENGKLLQKTLEELGKTKGLDTAFAVNRAEELANLPSSLFPVEQALKNLKEQFKFFEGKGKIDIEFDVTTEKIRAVEEARDKLLEVRETARNIEKTPVIIGFDFAMPAAPLLDFVIKNLTKDLDELKTAQQDVIDAKTLALLDAEAGAFKTIGAQVDVLTYQLEAARRRLRQLLQKQMDPKSELIPNSVIERAVDNIQRLEIALQLLKHQADITHLENLYREIGTADIGMNLLSAHINEVEDALRYLSDQNRGSSKEFEILADRLFALKNAETVVDILSGAFDEFFDAVIDGSENLGEVMGQIFKNIMLDIIKMLAKLLIVKTIMAILFPEYQLAMTAISVGPMLGTGMKEGGVVPQGFPNDTFPARLSSGEIVIPKDKYKDIDPLRQLAEKGRINASEFFDIPAEFMKTLEIPKMQKGGVVPAGYPNDTYPAWLTSGEIVLPNSYRDLDIERLMNRGSLPTGNINDEFQLLLSTYEKLAPEQAAKEKVTNKVFNYNNVTEKIMKMPRVKALNKLTTPKFPKEIKINDKYLKKLTAITKTNKPPVTPTRIPKIRTPRDMGVKIPKIRTMKDVAPKVMKIKVPKIAAPKMPSVKIPKIAAPRIPKIAIPKFTAPKIPKIAIPKIGTPKIPQIKLPKIASLSRVAKLSRTGALPKTYMRDTHLSRLSAKDMLLPSTRMDHLEPAQNNIHITLEGKIKNRDIALMIRRMKNWN